MPAALNIRDIGTDRKAAIEAEARLRGVSVADVVRSCIDEGLARAQAERDRSEWIAAARDGLEDEGRRSPTLARFRRPGARGA